MKAKTPSTRAAAAAPRETSHLNAAEQKALEAGSESEHQTGARKERLIREATRLAGKQPPRAK
jgi:hypothetical protein